MQRLAILLSLVLGSLSGPALAGDEVLASNAQAVQAERGKFFENEVRPLLIEHCIKCHGDDKQEGGLRLDTREGLMAGGDSGMAIEAGEPHASLILSAVRYEDNEMPPSGQLSLDKIEALAAWVRDGAVWPAGEAGMQLRAGGGISDADRDYWAFQALRSPEPPTVTQPQLVRTPVDAFVIAALEQVGLTLAPPADKATLLRRVTFDLVGVPPTPEELRDFLTDDRDDAYEQVVDRLLNDPNYGQKWAQHWLDLTRYAETDGFKQDADRPNAYLYRDWVIAALNADMPYDRFVALQLAGDELAPDDAQALAATGYLRSWIYEYNQRDARTQWSNILNDITDVTGEVFLGLGVGCARCHDHKFDPILQKDYFRLQASFATFIPRDDQLFGPPDAVADYRQKLAAWQTATAEIRRELAELEAPLRQSIQEKAYVKFPLDIRPILFKPAEQRDGFEQQIADLADRQVDAELANLDFSKSLKDQVKQRWEELQAELKQFDALRPEPMQTVLCAGTVLADTPPTTIPGAADAEPIVPESFEVFGGIPLRPSQPNESTSQRRAALAAWINDPANPLPHRVVVNRAWQAIFGEGIVQNVNDFGTLGSPPTHPELLDWLATWFLDHGRSFKSLHRLLVTSSAYRQTSRPPGEHMALGQQLDWENSLLWRARMRRLSAEQIRDAMLVAAGKLLPKSDGPPEAHNNFSRSVFTEVKRNQMHPLLVAFDAPDRISSVGQRNVTTTANQALLLSNAEWPIQIAGLMAARLSADSSAPEQHVLGAYGACLQRNPTEPELMEAVAFLEGTTRQMESIRRAEEIRNADESKNDPKNGFSNQPSGATTEAEPKDTEAEAKDVETSSANLSQVNLQNSSSPEAITSLNNAPWQQSEGYSTALTDFCHVLLNSSEFLYVQ